MFFIAFQWSVKAVCQISYSCGNHYCSSFLACGCFLNIHLSCGIVRLHFLGIRDWLMVSRKRQL